jgi:hypothetical protein
MKRLILLTCLLAFVSVAEAWAKRPGRSFRRSFVQVSARDPRYFCLSDGQPYIPVGCNIAAMGSVADMEHYLGKMHRNGANFGRVWLNTNLFEIETRYGEVDTAKLVRIDRLLELADRYGIKIKFCIESFRHIRPGVNKWDTKASYHTSNGGPFADADDYITSQRGEEEFLRRVRIFRERYGDHPAVFGWELWNEMNAVETPEEHLRAWNVRMLPRVKEIFPKNLVMQSLGSLDRESSFPIYEFINRLPPNEVAQVHRYIDEGAELAVCGAPVDSMASDAIAVLRGYGLRKPMLLAESGAVKPVHTGPHPIYKVDTMGSVLHDVLFAPFFSGAAGPGHLWHWDHHIDKQHTWFQMGRFARAVEGVDPLREGFEPVRRDTAGLCAAGRTHAACLVPRYGEHVAARALRTHSGTAAVRPAGRLHTAARRAQGEESADLRPLAGRVGARVPPCRRIASGLHALGGRPDRILKRRRVDDENGQINDKSVLYIPVPSS